MQENEFEKQVQQKMDDLKLHPSGAVWQKIEVHIRKEKRRRWVLILLPVLLIGFLFGSYMLLKDDNSHPELQQQATKNPIEKNYPAKETTAKPDTVKNYHPAEEVKETDAQTATVKTHRNQQIKTTPKLKISSDYIKTENVEKDHPPAYKNGADTIGNIVQHEKTGIDLQTVQQEKIAEDQHKPDSILTETGKSAEHPITVTDKEKKAENVIKTDSSAKDISVKKMEPEKKYSWNWGFSFAGGRSSMANSFLGYGQQSYDATQYSNANPGSFPGGYTSNPYPSLINPSIAFIAGISAERNISKKIIFTGGLLYKLFSTTNTVGIDSGNYFRINGPNRTYHNYYHYVDLPVGLKFQIFDFKKTRMYWNTGFSISWLIGSNALQYNGLTRLYYHDNSLFNKTQIGFNSGLDVGFLSKQKQSFLIGPYFNYHITKIAREGYNKHHFTFIGLRAQYLFRKK